MLVTSPDAILSIHGLDIPWPGNQNHRALMGGLKVRRGKLIDFGSLHDFVDAMFFYLPALEAFPIP